jgi:hypothetical protein
MVSREHLHLADHHMDLARGGRRDRWGSRGAVGISRRCWEVERVGGVGEARGRGKGLPSVSGSEACGRRRGGERTGGVGEGESGGKQNTMNCYFRLSMAVVGNFSRTPYLVSYCLVLEWQMRCSRTPVLFALELQTLDCSMKFWSRGVWLPYSIPNGPPGPSPALARSGPARCGPTLCRPDGF